MTLTNLYIFLSIANANSQRDTFCEVCTCVRGQGYILCSRGLPVLTKIKRTQKVQNLTLIVQSSYAFYYKYKTIVDSLFDNTLVRGQRHAYSTTESTKTVKKLI